MATSYQETDTAPPCTMTAGQVAPFCDAVNSGAATVDNRQAAVGGTAGTVAHTPNIDPNSTEDAVLFGSPVNDPNVTSWPAGNWTVRLNVTTANTNLSIDQILICRVNSACASQATVADSGTGLGISLGTTGVKSITVSGSAQTAAATDQWVILIVVHNAAAMTNQTFSYKADQLIDTPFGVVTVVPQRTLTGVGV